MSLGTPLLVECRKHRRSLALLLAAAIPLLIAVFMFFNLLRDKHPRSWDIWMGGAAGVWAVFMLPMGITALAVLLAQIEHGSRSWDHLRALPLPRWELYAAKEIWLLGCVALISLAIFAASAGAVWLAGALKPTLAPTGAFHALHYLGIFGRMYLAALLLMAVQLWAALRYASFVPALALGIGGTFFAVVASSAKVGVFLPWQMPLNMLATDPARMHLALILGCVGGTVASVAMLIHLHRREAL